MCSTLYPKHFTVHSACTADEALETLERLNGKVDLVILDVRLPAGNIFSPEASHGGFRTGLFLGALIKKEYPGVPIMGFSICNDEEVKRWFKKYGEKYVEKSFLMKPDDFYGHAEAIIRKMRGTSRKPKIFIVHGHDEEVKLKLKNYLQNTLKLGEPIILHEQPNLGRTIIEKLEEETVDIDIVFVILTPDDANADISWSDDQKRHARQNVIFELGFFYGKMTRRSGKIVLCYKGEIELPSDLSGIIYIDISAGIDSAGEKLRLELQEWLQE